MSEMTVVQREGISEPPRKSRKQSPLRLECYLCNRTRKLSDESFQYDHIVPREIFHPQVPDRYPAKLWICHECHMQKTFDESYVIQALRMSGMSRSATMAAEHSLAALSERHRLGLVRGILDQVKITELFSDGGIYLGNSLIFKLDKVRAHQFTANIAKGLWVAYLQEHIDWNNYQIVGDFIDMRISGLLLQEPYLSFRKMCFLYENWGDIFAYKGFYLKNLVSLWFLQYYDTQVAFVVIKHKNAEDNVDELDSIIQDLVASNHSL